MFKPLAYFAYTRRASACRDFLKAYAEYNNDRTEATWNALHDAAPAAARAMERAGMVWKSYPAPAIGGPVLSINVAREVFNERMLDQIDISPEFIVNITRQTIAHYDDARRSALWHLVNPLSWIWSTIELVLGLPFRLIATTGLNAHKVEDSLLGKLLKLILLVLSILVALQKLGWLDDLVGFFRK